MRLKRPTIEDIDLIAQQFGLDLATEDLISFQALMEGPLASSARHEQLPWPTPEVKYPRTPGYRPDGEENPLNAWYYR